MNDAVVTSSLLPLVSVDFTGMSSLIVFPLNLILFLLLDLDLDLGGLSRGERFGVHHAVHAGRREEAAL